MKVVVVAVRDQAVDGFSNPWFAQTVPMAIRHFSDAVNNPDQTNQWNKHPEDFCLFKLGEFETSTGRFETHDPQQLCIAREVLQK